MKLLRELSSASYSGWFAFHNYNEPLADPTILAKVTEAREFLKLAKLTIYTNGDFLRPPLFQELKAAGLDEIRVTLYPRGSSDHPRLDSIQRFLSRVEIAPSQSVTSTGPKGIVSKVRLDHLSLVVISPNVALYTNRAGSVPSGVTRGTHRTSPCILPFVSAAIDYRGNLKMCCQIYDVAAPKSKPYLIGSLRDSTFLELWTSGRMDRIRRDTGRGDFRRLPACQHCSHIPSEQQIRSARSCAS